MTDERSGIEFIDKTMPDGSTVKWAVRGKDPELELLQQLANSIHRFPEEGVFAFIDSNDRFYMFTSKTAVLDYFRRTPNMTDLIKMVIDRLNSQDLTKV